MSSFEWVEMGNERTVDKAEWLVQHLPETHESFPSGKLLDWLNYYQCLYLSYTGIEAPKWMWGRKVK